MVPASGGTLDRKVNLCIFDQCYLCLCFSCLKELCGIFSNDVFDSILRLCASLGINKRLFGLGYFQMPMHAQSCPTLCEPMDSSLPDFSIHGILQ